MPNAGTIPEDAPHRRHAWLWPPIVIAAAFAHNLYVSWLKWGDVLVDCGRELDIARQMSEGKTLYVDLRYWYGPLAPWIDSALFRIFGVSAEVLAAAGVACAALVCLVLYRLVRCFSTRLCATSVVVLFLYACAFAHLTPNGIFNFVLPYGQCATYGILVCLSSIYFLIRYTQEFRGRDFVLAIAFLIGAALTKIELFTAVSAAHVTAVAGLIWAAKCSWKRMIAGYFFAGLSIVAIYVAIYLRVGPSLFSDNLLVLLSPGIRKYTMAKSGFEDWQRSLAQMMLSVACLAFVACAFAVVGFFSRRAAKANVITAATAFVMGAAVYSQISVDLCFRFVPLVAALVLLAWTIRCWHSKEFRVRAVPHLVLWVFAVFCLSRLILRPGAYHYGFYVLIPALTCIGILWFEYLPEAVNLFLKQRKMLPIEGRAFSGGGAGVLAGIAAAHFLLSLELYEHRTVEIKTPQIHTFVLDRIQGIPIGRIYAETIRLLSTQPRDTRVFAFPQGVGLMFCAGLANPYGSGGFYPLEVVENYDDEHILDRLKARPPHLILSTPGTDEFPQQFGQDYAQKTWAWIAENYEPAISLGPGDFMLIMKRKDAPFPFPDVPPEFRAK